MPMVPPDDMEFTSTLAPPTEEPEETTVGATVATTVAGGGGGACACNDVPPAVTQQFLNDRIATTVDNAELPESMEPGLISCGLSVGCLYGVSFSSMEGTYDFLVTPAQGSGDDVITLFQDSQLICSDGKWLNGNQPVIAMGCYGVLK